MTSKLFWQKRAWQSSRLRSPWEAKPLQVSWSSDGGAPTWAGTHRPDDADPIHTITITITGIDGSSAPADFDYIYTYSSISMFD